MQIYANTSINITHIQFAFYKSQI